MTRIMRPLSEAVGTGTLHPGISSFVQPVTPSQLSVVQGFWSSQFTFELN